MGGGLFVLGDLVLEMLEGGQIRFMSLVLAHFEFSESISENLDGILQLGKVRFFCLGPGLHGSRMKAPMIRREMAKLIPN